MCRFVFYNIRFDHVFKKKTRRQTSQLKLTTNIIELEILRGIHSKVPNQHNQTTPHELVDHVY